mgnify:CR=1 FL=1
MTTEQNEIRDIITRYFNILYKDDLIDDNSTCLNNNSGFQDNNIPSQDRSEMSRPLNSAEIEDAIKYSPKNKSPGEDGLSIEFYIKFWNFIKEDIVEIMNSLLQVPTIPEKLCRGVLVLIPKTANPAKIEDYRPITLLNSDYKIFMRCMKTRIIPHMEKIISPIQQCAVTGRNIFNAASAIRDVISSSKHYKQSRLLVSVDLDHAFDRIRHSFISSTLIKKGINQEYVQCIQRILSAGTTRILINGHLSEPIKIERSVRQGCPMSMHLFVIAIDPLLTELNKVLNRFVSPCNIIRAYADDITFTASNLNQLQEIKQVLDTQLTKSGGKLNEKKTKGMIIGPTYNLETPIWITKTHNVKIVGVLYHNNIAETIRENWNLVTNSIRRVLAENKQRQFNLLQRAIFINMFALSKAYLCQNSLVKN